MGRGYYNEKKARVRIKEKKRIEKEIEENWGDKNSKGERSRERMGIIRRVEKIKENE